MSEPPQVTAPRLGLFLKAVLALSTLSLLVIAANSANELIARTTYKNAVELDARVGVESDAERAVKMKREYNDSLRTWGAKWEAYGLKPLQRYTLSNP